MSVLKYLDREVGIADLSGVWIIVANTDMCIDDGVVMSRK